MAHQARERCCDTAHLVLEFRGEGFADVPETLRDVDVVAGLLK
jgi:hypothetical protein